MDAYYGEIRMFAGDYAPRQWALCNGAYLTITDHQELYSLLGITYGGDGVTNFRLPDLRGRVPMGDGTGIGLSTRIQGQFFGTETVTLVETNMPRHQHYFMASTNTNGTSDPTNQVLGDTTPNNYYEPIDNDETIVALHPDSVENVGYGQPHLNIMPVSCINFIICLDGLYPPRNN